MALHAHLERLQSPQDQKGVERRERRAGERSKTRSADLFDQRARSDDRAAKQIAMAAKIFRRRVNDEVRPKLERILQNWRREGVVDDRKRAD